MKDMDSLTRLRLKIVGGYVSLIALFIVASIIVVCKSGNLEENSKRYRENIDRRALSRRSGDSDLLYNIKGLRSMLTYYNNYVPLVQLKTINMPRQARKTSGTGIYHVMLRGIYRQDIFKDDEDYMQFQRSLHQLVECYDEPAHSISDTGIKELLRLQYSNDNAMDVQNLEKNQRNKIIKELCNQGAGFRQLARITGFSYWIIQRVVTDQSPLI